eukprot:scaffold67476_cov51-Phaeocystis_antarctica.AAC.1
MSSDWPPSWAPSCSPSWAPRWAPSLGGCGSGGVKGCTRGGESCATAAAKGGEQCCGLGRTRKLATT